MADKNIDKIATDITADSGSINPEKNIESNISERLELATERAKNGTATYEDRNLLNLAGLMYDKLAVNNQQSTTNAKEPAVIETTVEDDKADPKMKFDHYVGVRGVRVVEPKDIKGPSLQRVQELIRTIDTKKGQPKAVDDEKSLIVRTAESMKNIKNQIAKLEAETDTDGTKAAKIEDLQQQLAAQQRLRNEGTPEEKGIKDWNSTHQPGAKKIVPVSSAIDPTTGKQKNDNSGERIDRKTNASEIPEDQLSDIQKPFAEWKKQSMDNIHQIQDEILELDGQEDVDGQKAAKMLALLQNLENEQKDYKKLSLRPLKDPLRKGKMIYPGTPFERMEEEKIAYPDTPYEKMSLEQLKLLETAFSNYYKDGTTTYNIIDEIKRREAAEKRKHRIEKDEEEEEEEEEIEEKKETTEKLELKAGRSKKLIRELFEVVVKADEKEQAENRFNLKTQRNIFKAVASRIKHGALFKKNTQTLGAYEMMQSLEKESTDGLLTVERWNKFLLDNNRTPTKDLEEAFLGLVASNMDGLTTNIEAPEATKDDIKSICLNYVNKVKNENLSPNLIPAVQANYALQIQSAIAKAMNADPTLKKSDLEVYADNAKEILERCLATSRHETAMNNVQKMLDGMKITIGERQLGANSTTDTAYLEKLNEKGKIHNTVSVIGKASFVIGSWVSTGVAIGLAVRGAKMAATTGTSVIVGTALAGPIGALVGLGVGAIASGAWGRYLARRRGTDTSGIASSDVNIDNGFAMDTTGRLMMKKYLDKDGNLKANLTPEQRAKANKISVEHQTETTMDKLKPAQESMPDIINELSQYMELIDGQPANDPRSYRVKQNLGPDKLLAPAMTIEKILAKLDCQKTYNDNAERIAAKRDAAGNLQKTLRTTVDENSRALNLFGASTQEAYTPEMFKMLTFVAKLQEVVNTDKFKKQTATFPINNDQLNSKGEGTTTPHTRTYESILNTVATDTRKIVNEKIIPDWQDRNNKYINHVGRVGGATSFATTLVAGALVSVGLSAARELATNGEANTMLNSFFGNQETVIPGETFEIDVIKNTDNTVTVDAPTGEIKIPVDPKTGAIINFDKWKALLKEQGVEIAQQTKPNGTSTIHAGEMLEKLGGKHGNVEEWWNNNSVGADGSERTFSTYRAANGDIICTQPDTVATLGNRSVDVGEKGALGEVFVRFRENGILKVMDEPMTPVPGKNILRYVIPADSPYAQMFTESGRLPLIDNVGSTIVDKATGVMGSIATDVGRGSADIVTQNLATSFTAAGTTAAKQIARAIDWIVGGVKSPGTKSIYDGVLHRPNTEGTDKNQNPRVEPDETNQGPAEPAVPPVITPINKNDSSEGTEPDLIEDLKVAEEKAGKALREKDLKTYEEEHKKALELREKINAKKNENPDENKPETVDYSTMDIDGLRKERVKALANNDQPEAERILSLLEKNIKEENEKYDEALKEYQAAMAENSKHPGPETAAKFQAAKEKYEKTRFYLPESVKKARTASEILDDFKKVENAPEGTPEAAEAAKLKKEYDELEAQTLKEMKRNQRLANSTEFSVESLEKKTTEELAEAFKDIFQRASVNTNLFRTPEYKNTKNVYFERLKNGLVDPTEGQQKSTVLPPPVKPTGTEFSVKPEFIGALNQIRAENGGTDNSPEMAKAFSIFNTFALPAIKARQNGDIAEYDRLNALGTQELQDLIKSNNSKGDSSSTPAEQVEPPIIKPEEVPETVPEEIAEPEPQEPPAQEVEVPENSEVTLTPAEQLKATGRIRLTLPTTTGKPEESSYRGLEGINADIDFYEQMQRGYAKTRQDGEMTPNMERRERIENEILDILRQARDSLSPTEKKPDESLLKEPELSPIIETGLEAQNESESKAEIITGSTGPVKQKNPYEGYSNEAIDDEYLRLTSLRNSQAKKYNLHKLSDEFQNRQGLPEGQGAQFSAEANPFKPFPDHIYTQTGPDSEQAESSRNPYMGLGLDEIDKQSMLVLGQEDSPEKEAKLQQLGEAFDEATKKGNDSEVAQPVEENINEKNDDDNNIPPSSGGTPIKDETEEVIDESVGLKSEVVNPNTIQGGFTVDQKFIDGLPEETIPDVTALSPAEQFRTTGRVVLELPGADGKTISTPYASLKAINSEIDSLQEIVDNGKAQTESGQTTPYIEEMRKVYGQRLIILKQARDNIQPPSEGQPVDTKEQFDADWEKTANGTLGIRGKARTDSSVVRSPEYQDNKEQLVELASRLPGSEIEQTSLPTPGEQYKDTGSFTLLLPGIESDLLVPKTYTDLDQLEKDIASAESEKRRYRNDVINASTDAAQETARKKSDLFSKKLDILQQAKNDIEKANANSKEAENSARPEDLGFSGVYEVAKKDQKQEEEQPALTISEQFKKSGSFSLELPSLEDGSLEPAVYTDPAQLDKAIAATKRQRQSLSKETRWDRKNPVSSSIKKRSMSYWADARIKALEEAKAEILAPSETAAKPEESGFSSAFSELPQEPETAGATLSKKEGSETNYVLTGSGGITVKTPSHLDNETVTNTFDNLEELDSAIKVATTHRDEWEQNLQLPGATEEFKNDSIKESQRWSTIVEAFETARKMLVGQNDALISHTVTPQEGEGTTEAGNPEGYAFTGYFNKPGGTRPELSTTIAPGPASAMFALEKPQSLEKARAEQEAAMPPTEGSAWYYQAAKMFEKTNRAEYDRLTKLGDSVKAVEDRRTKIGKTYQRIKNRVPGTAGRVIDGIKRAVVTGAAKDDM